MIEPTTDSAVLVEQEQRYDAAVEVRFRAAKWAADGSRHLAVETAEEMAACFIRALEIDCALAARWEA